MVSTTTPRGLRNNNPLNIRISNNNWKGKVVPSKDPMFETFESMEYGIRAAFIIIRNYIKKYNLKTVGKIIQRFAPPTENNLLNYISYVGMYSGLDRCDEVSFENKEQMVKLLHAMSFYEIGKYLSRNQFREVYEKYFGK